MAKVHIKAPEAVILAEQMKFGEFALVRSSGKIVLRCGLGFVYVDGSASFASTEFQREVVLLPSGTKLTITI